jgi:hypothetical protein
MATPESDDFFEILKNGQSEADGSRFGSVGWSCAGRLHRQAALSHALGKRFPPALIPPLVNSGHHDGANGLDGNPPACNETSSDTTSEVTSPTLWENRDRAPNESLNFTCASPALN